MRLSAECDSRHNKNEPFVSPTAFRCKPYLRVVEALGPARNKGGEDDKERKIHSRLGCVVRNLRICRFVHRGLHPAQSGFLKNGANAAENKPGSGQTRARLLLCLPHAARNTIRL